ncbi:hypothetical protein PGT21_015801 [Puccinia graminis f. sp. tritici]|uniref:DUF8040 domain-containing protein n=1 Tax=Puccinia graminis f. sp. tritici TaxID=56615 RepID=A0A5B0QMW1_PUCGR|nr:hypothetical protein PGT21_015801 [Puccinia graminis f. sp. tritici]
MNSPPPAPQRDLSSIQIHSRFQEQQLRVMIKLLIIIVILATLYEWSKSFKSPYNNSSLPGARYVEFILRGNRSRCRTMFRLNNDTFELLAQKLSHLDFHPASRALAMEEQLAIFMYIVGQAATNRQA